MCICVGVPLPLAVLLLPKAGWRIPLQRFLCVQQARCGCFVDGRLEHRGGLTAGERRRRRRLLPNQPVYGMCVELEGVWGLRVYVEMWWGAKR